MTAGNQPFQVHSEVRGTPGAGNDRIWVGGTGALAVPGTLATARSNAVPLTGGNINVRHRAGAGTP